jgi:hypothetical protein
MLKTYLHVEFAQAATLSQGLRLEADESMGSAGLKDFEKGRPFLN